MEDFVWACDFGQRVDRNEDKKEATVWHIPVILEVYSWLNIHVEIPLISSLRDNRYLITSIYATSKYPDALAAHSFSS